MMRNEIPGSSTASGFMPAPVIHPGPTLGYRVELGGQVGHLPLGPRARPGWSDQAARLDIGLRARGGRGRPVPRWPVHGRGIPATDRLGAPAASSRLPHSPTWRQPSDWSSSTTSPTTTTKCSTRCSCRASRNAGADPQKPGSKGWCSSYQVLVPDVAVGRAVIGGRCRSWTSDSRSSPRTASNAPSRSRGRRRPPGSATAGCSTRTCRSWRSIRCSR